MIRNLLLPLLCALLSTGAAATIDTLHFGEAASEKAHALKGDHTTIIRGALDESARTATATGAPAGRTGDLAFTVHVDPVAQNYFTLKFWGEDTAGLTLVDIAGLQIGYRMKGDYEPINSHNGKALPGRFYYGTILLPLEQTRGRESVELTLRTYLEKDETTSRGFYQAYVHNDPLLDVASEKQGPKLPAPIAELLAPAPTEGQVTTFLADYRQAQITDFNQFGAKVDAAPDAKLSIIRYQDELRIYSEMLRQPWCPAQSPAEKRLALERIFKSIDNHVKDYYADIRLVTHGGHQGDWGGYYGALGEALYIVDSLIQDPAIYGSETFQKFLNEPFPTGTVAGEFSLAESNWEGGPLTRRDAWERTLKANFDFARSRLSYIYNQMLYTYEGAWEAHEGLRVIGSRFYEGKPRSHRIFREFIGIAPFLGEEILTAPDGRVLDVYHSLFRHDLEAVFTDDTLQIVAKGLAKSLLDASGQVSRRRPYGDHYFGMTTAGLTRENGYVGNYGETPNYLPEYFYRTLGQPGDEALNDDILKVALLNLHARGYTRYTSLDDNGQRVMRMQQVLDERNSAYPGMLAYATRFSFGKALLYASLEKHMADHSDRYAAPDWADTWRYAREAVGFAQQQIADHQMISSKEAAAGAMSSRKLDFRLPETYAYVTEERAGYPRFSQTPAGVVHPLTDFDYYQPEELEKLRVDPADYTRLAWADLDNLMIVLRDGPTQITGIFNFRNRGFTGSGRLHVVQPHFEHLTQIAVRAKFQYRDYYLRMNDYNFDYMVNKPSAEAPRRNAPPQTNIPDVINNRPGDGARPQALAGEVCPITFQPGVGPVVRDNFEIDHPYAAYPDYVEARYGNYLFVFNTTRPDYGNARSFNIEIPTDHTAGSVLEMISGKSLAIRGDRSVTIPATSALVLRLDSAQAAPAKPAPVDFVAALAGNGSAALTWKTAAGAISYTVARSTDENGPYSTIREGISENKFTDTPLPAGSDFYYQITPRNSTGSGWPSYRAHLAIPASASLPATAAPWRDDRLGDATTGTAEIKNDAITIRDGNGTGLGKGNDYRIETRDIRDSLHFVSQPIDGSFSISAKITSAKGPQSGIFLRDRLLPNSRYFFLGADAEGRLILQNRTRDTRHEVSLQVISPQVIALPDYTLATHPYLKVSRDAATQFITASASPDGETWTEVGKLFTPFPGTIHAGLAASETLETTDVRVVPVSKTDPK